jgi:hypothetical protein
MIPGAVKWAGLTLLAIVVQVALALIGFEAPALGALHGINAFIILGLASMAIRSAKTDRALATSTRHEPAAV